MIGPSVVVFEYGAGNIHSACQALAEMGARVTLTDGAQKVRDADGVMVPGVGAIGYVMDRFRSHGGQDLMLERVQADKPLLGICVGMQILFQDATEKGAHEGLGFFNGTVEELPAARLPHMGWGQVQCPVGSQMFQDIADAHFYFVHSYARLLQPGQAIENCQHPDRTVLTTAAPHGTQFAAALESGPLWATQFHPEKSGAAGLRLLGNWLNTI